MIRKSILIWTLFKLMFSVQTRAGRDWQIGLMSTANQMGFSTLDAEPLETDTALGSEINSGTLARGPAVVSHTSGTDVYALTRVVTSDQHVTLYQVGIFTDEGLLVFARRFTGGEFFPGDRFQLTHSVTLTEP